MSTLGDGAREFGIELSAGQIDAFNSYYKQLVEWNARVNLTAITGYSQVEVLHFLDSLSVVPALPRGELDGKTLVDVGAGAGFPGVPLAIALPYLHVTLLEATGKKAVFLDFISRELGLENVAVLRGRAEDLSQKPEYRERFHYATARAVAGMRTLVEYTLPFVRVGGLFAASKSADAAEETRAAAHAIDLLGGRLRELVPVTLPTLNELRYIVVVEKVAPTPTRYPRRAGVPERKPL
jgi:16S rRNA (guanine527-N7)-methyltransferase